MCAVLKLLEKLAASAFIIFYPALNVILQHYLLRDSPPVLSTIQKMTGHFFVITIPLYVLMQLAFVLVPPVLLLHYMLRSASLGRRVLSIIAYLAVMFPVVVVLVCFSGMLFEKEVAFP